MQTVTLSAMLVVSLASILLILPLPLHVRRSSSFSTRVVETYWPPTACPRSFITPKRALAVLLHLYFMSHYRVTSASHRRGMLDNANCSYIVHHLRFNDLEMMPAPRSHFPLRLP